MKSSVEARCIVCHLIFCCGDCRWKHEKTTHGLTYDCPICRGNRFLCIPEQLNKDFIQHLTREHFPLQCRKCNKLFTKMEDLTDVDKCSTISELVESNIEDKKEENIEEKFDSLYEKVNSDGENFEAIVSINSSTKTAVITPIIRKKCLVDYESTDTEWEDSPKKDIATPHSITDQKSASIKRAATPHIKKLLRQKRVGMYDDTVDEENDSDVPANGKTPLRSNNLEIPEPDKEMTTPTSQLPHVLKLLEVVTTSTPTHPGTWSLFSGPGTDSPLSEIEQTGSPVESIDKEPSRTEENTHPKLKGIISRIKLSTQDSSEKQVTFQDSENVTESSVKSKKVKFAEDTVFKSEAKPKRVFSKPRRMLTPGRQRPRLAHNPRFQALINRFESQKLPVTQTPVTKKEEEQSLESTPPAGEHNIPARAICFKDDSPVVESESQSKEANELFRSCVSSPAPINNAITSLTTNIAGTLQTCLTSVLRSTDEETEIQFKFVITKKKVSVKRIAEDADLQKYEIEREEQSNKENIWSTVAKAVKNVFWGSQGNYNTSQVTPYTSISSNDTTSSSASKRKFDEMSDSDHSPLNHKRHKYVGRIRGRPPLHSSSTCSVSCLRSAHSAEQHSMLKELSMYQEEHMNSSF